ncbi:cytochrome P450 [Kitasatospora sp. NPDC058162]|uniref:cytochrome P450 n=1 Tax=Kitasatospora sp. NPDC058162 TaxID=3346362 RepID=UPI0036DE88B3
MRITSSGLSADIDLDAIDLFDPGFYATGDPHPVWKLMREKAPAHRQTLPDGRSFLSVTRYADVSAVLRDHTRFTSRRGTVLSVLGSTDPAGNKMLAASDPPVHTAMREPLNRVMSFTALEAQKPQVKRLVHRMLAPLADGGTFELAAAATAFPMAFTGLLMGLPEEDLGDLARLATMAVAPEDAMFQEGEVGGNLVTAHHELFEYLAERVGPSAGQDNLIGYLVGMDAGGRRLRHDEIVFNSYSMLLGANATTPHSIAATILALIEHPEQYARLREDPELVAPAVEEGLRWASPANHFLRHAVTDTEIAGTPVRRGEAVVAWIGSANRDESVFTDPYRFDVGRSPNRHLAFGWGPHYCIGAPLARIALRLLFGELARLVERLEPTGEVEHLTSNFIAGIKRMPVVATLRAGADEVLAAANEETRVPR